MTITKERPSTTALKTKPSLRLDRDYIAFFQQIKEKLKKAQIRASLAANVEQIRFYWETGKAIAEKQASKQWG